MSDCIYSNVKPLDTGYVKVTHNGRRVKAHRLAYELAHGPIPSGFVVDHICHNKAAAIGACSGGKSCTHRACINVEHLRLVTPSENIMSGVHSMNVRGECPKGHSYSEAKNVMVRRDGKRECAECNRERSRANWARKRRAEMRDA